MKNSAKAIGIIIATAITTSGGLLGFYQSRQTTISGRVAREFGDVYQLAHSSIHSQTVTENTYGFSLVADRETYFVSVEGAPAELSALEQAIVTGTSVSVVSREKRKDLVVRRNDVEVE